MEAGGMEVAPGRDTYKRTITGVEVENAIVEPSRREATSFRRCRAGLTVGRRTRYRQRLAASLTRSDRSPRSRVLSPAIRGAPAAFELSAEVSWAVRSGSR